MSLLSLPELKAEVIRIGNLIGATDPDLPLFGVNEENNKYYCPRVDVDGVGYQFVFLSRGKPQENTRVTTSDLDELFYHIFQYVISVMTNRYAADHRIGNEVSPRLRFQKQVEQVTMLSGFKWADRYAKELDKRAQELERLYKLEAEVQRLAGLIGAVGDSSIPTFGGYRRGGDDEFCVEVDGDGYRYFYNERGSERTEVTTSDLDELFYHIFQPVTYQLASQYARQHRISNQDPRRLMFQKQEELLAVLSPQWADRTAKERDKILQSNPYNDR
jgi:hypothetical protein